MAIARISVTDIRPDSLVGRTDSLATGYRQNSRPTTSPARVAVLHLSTSTGSSFVFRLQDRSKLVPPSSRFKISSDSFINKHGFFILEFRSTLVSAISSPTI